MSVATITISNRQRIKTVNRRMLKQITAALLAGLKVTNADLGIYLIAAPEMTRLNETFLKHRGPTDVIAFDYANPGGQCFVTAPKIRASAKRCPPLHGEIFVCVDEAIVQARKFGTCWQSEIVRYVVHGVLHLLGHDDRRAAARRTMRREENRLVRGLSRRFSLAQPARAAKIAP